MGWMGELGVRLIRTLSLEGLGRAVSQHVGAHLWLLVRILAWDKEFGWPGGKAYMNDAFIYWCLK